MTQLACPIFPLTLVLFPGTPQLLHIFEPRYRQMLDDCMAGDRRFGISFVEPGGVTEPLPEPGEVGCLAYVQAVRRLPDGRSHIVTIGQERYVLLGFVAADRLYRVAQVETFDDEREAGEGSDDAGEQVRSAFGKFAAGMTALTDATPGSLDLPPDLTALSFQVAAALDIDPKAKQELLALRSTAQRLARLAHLLDGLNHEIESRVSVHARARRNGKGGRDHTVQIVGDP
jgi:Lon protease-like protein